MGNTSQLHLQKFLYRNEIFNLESVRLHPYSKLFKSSPKKRKYPVGNDKQSINSGNQRLKGSWFTFNCICFLFCFSNAGRYLQKWNRRKFESMQHMHFFTGLTSLHQKGTQSQNERTKRDNKHLITIKCNFLQDRKFWHTTLKSGNSHFQESIHHLTFYAIIPQCNIFNTKEHFPQIAGNDSYLQFSSFNCSHCWSYHPRF